MGDMLMQFNALIGGVFGASIGFLLLVASAVLVAVPFLLFYHRPSSGGSQRPNAYGGHEL